MTDDKTPPANPNQEEELQKAALHERAQLIRRGGLAGFNHSGAYVGGTDGSARNFNTDRNLGSFSSHVSRLDETREAEEKDNGPKK